MKTTQIKLLFFLVITMVAAGCSIHGHYTSSPKSNSLDLAGYEFILTKNEAFHIRSWTDNATVYSDSLGNRIWEDPHYRGFGTFVQIGDSLELTFLNEDSITVEIEKTTSEAVANYKLSIINEIGQMHAPILSLKDSASKTLKTVFNGSETYTEFQDSLNSEVSKIGFDLHLFGSPEILFSLNEISNGRNVFKFKTHNGYYPRASKAKVYCKKAWSGIRYGPRKRWLAKKYKQKWINNLYKD